jgi:hypothetical protein
MRIANLIWLWLTNLSMHVGHLMHQHRLILAVAPLLLQAAGTGWADTGVIYTGPTEITDSSSPGVC